MSQVIQILKSSQELGLKNEDGDILELEVSTPLSEQDVKDRESRLGFEIPEQLRDLMMFSNGLLLFGLQIMSIEEQQYYPVQGLLSFHNWGNGDFDCIATSASDYPEGSIVFMNHSPEITVKIEDTLVEWLAKATDEIRKYGALLHPRDYMTNPDFSEGLYGGVLHALAGVDSELNS